MSNVIKFQAPFEKIKKYENCPDIILRKAIITQAIIDASSNSTLPLDKKNALKALEWLLCETNDYFNNLCIQSNLEPSFVRKNAKKIIKIHKDKDSRQV